MDGGPNRGDPCQGSFDAFRADRVEEIGQDLPTEGFRCLEDARLIRRSVRVRVQAEAGGGTAVFSLIGIGLLDRRPFLFEYRPTDPFFAPTGHCPRVPPFALPP